MYLLFLPSKLLMLLFGSHHFDQTISQFSLAMGAAIHTSHPQCEFLPHMLAKFRNLEIRNGHLTEVAYKWCSMVCESHSNLENREDLLLLALEIGFRHISPQSDWMEAKLTHMESHQKMVNIVFQSGQHEAIADLLCSWTSTSISHHPHPSLKTCAKYLVGLSHLQPFSPRLQQAIIKSIDLIDHKEFEQVGMEGVIGLLDGLHVNIDNIPKNHGWTGLLLNIVQSPEGIQYASHQYWELLVELVVSFPWGLGGNTCGPHTMKSLEDAKEWDKLECWMGIIWIKQSLDEDLEADEELETDEELEHVTLSLFQQRPGAIQRLEHWVGKMSLYSARQRSKSFQQMFDEVYPNGGQSVQ